jgi:hypothetical protein
LTRHPYKGHPTLSRLESSVVEVECEAINAVLLEQFLVCPRKPPREVVLDFDTSWYQAKGWKRMRRVVVQAEETGLGPNPRFVLVDGLCGTPRQQYQFYGRRGACENRIKEMKQAIKTDRTSCCEFASNKVRLMLHAVAYVLFQRLRRIARNTGYSRAQVESLRWALIKIAALVRESGRRVHVALASACPTQELFRKLCGRLGVVSG